MLVRIPPQAENTTNKNSSTLMWYVDYLAALLNRHRYTLLASISFDAIFVYHNSLNCTHLLEHTYSRSHVKKRHLPRHNYSPSQLCNKGTELLDCFYSRFGHDFENIKISIGDKSLHTKVRHPKYSFWKVTERRNPHLCIAIVPCQVRSVPGSQHSARHCHR